MDPTAAPRRAMTDEESVVSFAADAADERTEEGNETGPGVWHRHFLAALNERGYVVVRTEEAIPYDLRLSFTPNAIREHFEDGDEDDNPTTGLTDEQLADVGRHALTDDGLYRAFHESLVWALDTDETKED